MGFDIVWVNEEGEAAEFDTGDMKLGLFKRQEMAEIVGSSKKPVSAECQDQVALIFTVHDLGQAYQQLKDNGATFVTQPMNRPEWEIRTAYLRDPDGILIGLYEISV